MRAVRYSCHVEKDVLTVDFELTGHNIEKRRAAIRGLSHAFTVPIIVIGGGALGLFAIDLKNGLINAGAGIGPRNSQRLHAF